MEVPCFITLYEVGTEKVEAWIQEHRGLGDTPYGQSNKDKNLIKLIHDNKVKWNEDKRPTHEL